ncbi:hypothetical protein ACF068_06965 [Streptomyces sp. NPDC016309]|uniref:hypothetical protein n=1 Tax=Streptomyces sp. NPDC016309 TaxID=3364965 RepID=UPI0036FE3104
MAEHDGGAVPGHVSGIQAGRDVRISRSTVAVGHTASVSGAPAAEREAAVAELRAAVDRLREELRGHAGHYEDGAELVQAAEQVRTELDRDEPRRNILLRWLGFIAPGVHATAAVAADVASIQESVTALF